MRTIALAALVLAPELLAQQTPNPLNLWLVELNWAGNRLTTGTPIKLTNDNGSNSQPAFTPDGRAIVFSAVRDTGAGARSDIYRIDLATRAETRVTTTPENENSPTVNARGEYVAIRWIPATLFKEFGPWVYDATGTPLRGVLRAPDTTGYYTPLDNGDYALTRPKSKTFTLGLFDARTGAIVDVDSGIPALPAQRIPGTRALSYVRIDSVDAKHMLRRVDLATKKTEDLGPTVIGRTAHAWVAGRNTILMAKGNVLYARTLSDPVWRQVTTFDNPEMGNASAYVVSPQGDKLILTSQKRRTLATIIRDSIENGRPAREVAALVLRMRDAGQLAGVDITEGPIGGYGDDRVQKERFDDAIAIHTLATTLFPQSYRAVYRLALAHEAAGHRDQAVELYRTVSAMNPQRTDADRRLADDVAKKLGAPNPMARMPEVRRLVVAKNAAGALALIDSLAALVPGHPNSAFLRAHALGLAGRMDEAANEITRLLRWDARYARAALRDSNVLALRSRFAAVDSMATLAERAVSSAAVWAIIQERDLIAEGTAYDPQTRSVLIGSLNKHKVIAIAPDGSVSDRVTPNTNGLRSVAGIHVDSVRRTLWVTSNARYDTPTDSTRSALFAFDAATGAFKARIPVPDSGRHFLNDVVTGPDGTVYATDSQSGHVWFASPGATQLQPFRIGTFYSPNGVTITPDGAVLFVADVDHIRGRDLRTGAEWRIALPDSINVSGIDGLAFVNGTLIAHHPLAFWRIARYQLDPAFRRITGRTMIEANTPDSRTATTGEIVGTDYVFIGNSQIDRMNLRTIDAATMEPIRIYRVRATTSTP